jgi:NADH:ubiquinone oxidoreductase subunit 3 (subunit A)
MEDEKLLPVGTPSPKAQSWGTVISIIIIVLMIIIGAYYAWSKRIAQENALLAPAATAAP